MTRFVGHDMANDGHAKEGEVSNAVQYLMADKLVFVSKARWIQYAVLVNDHGVIQRSATGKTILLQVLDFMEKTKGPGMADLRFEKPVFQRNRMGLFS